MFCVRLRANCTSLHFDLIDFIDRTFSTISSFSIAPFLTYSIGNWCRRQKFKVRKTFCTCCFYNSASATHSQLLSLSGCTTFIHILMFIDIDFCLLAQCNRKFKMNEINVHQLNITGKRDLPLAEINFSSYPMCVCALWRKLIAHIAIVWTEETEKKTELGRVWPINKHLALTKC